MIFEGRKLGRKEAKREKREKGDGRRGDGIFLGRALLLTKRLVLVSSCSGYGTIVEP